MLFTVVVLVLFIYLIFQRSKGLSDNFPPGPAGFPILGHLPKLGQYPHKTFLKWKNTFGPIIGIWLGDYRVVVLQDSKLIQEAMNLDAFSGRPDNIFAPPGGITECHGKDLKNKRKFFLNSVRIFGSTSKEAKMQEEISTLLNELVCTTGKPLSLNFVFNLALINSMSNILFGTKLDKTDPEVIKFVQETSLIMEEINPVVSLTMFLPWLKKIVPKGLTMDYNLRIHYNKLKLFIKPLLKVNNNNNIEDQSKNVIDAYTNELRRRNSRAINFQPVEDFPILNEVFIALMDATNRALQWICVYLINFPEVQRKLQDEVVQVVGHERSPCLADRPKLNYTDAVIHEILRHCSQTAIALPHKAMKDVKFHNYFIPKNTIIMCNYYSCNYDREIWKDPESFRPEHFLDENNLFRGNSNFHPFGTGKRSCMGESLARDQLFLYTTNLMQQFDICSAGKLPTLDPICGVGLLAKDCKIIFKKRSAKEIICN